MPISTTPTAPAVHLEGIITTVLSGINFHYGNGMQMIDWIQQEVTETPAAFLSFNSFRTSEPYEKGAWSSEAKGEAYMLLLRTEEDVRETARTLVKAFEIEGNFLFRDDDDINRVVNISSGAASQQFGYDIFELTIQII